MKKWTELFEILRTGTIEVPIWEILTMVAIAALYMLFRGTKTGLLILYVFALHIAFGVLKEFFSPFILLLIGIFGAIILLVGLFEAFSER